MKEVMVTLRKLSAEESERRLAEWRVKEDRDRRSAYVGGVEDGEKIGEARGIEIGEARGLEKGREEGRAEGREEGRAEGRMESLSDIARKMKEKGFSDAQIAEITGVS